MPHTFSDSELLWSIGRVGVLLPVVRLNGETVDGKRREHCAAAKCCSVPVFEASTTLDAARAVWPCHPDRAIRLLGVDNTPGELAEKLGVRVSAVLGALDTMPDSPRKRVSRVRRQRPIRHERVIDRIDRYLNRCEQGIELLDLERLRELLRAR